MSKAKKAVAELNYKKHDDVPIRLILIDEEGKKNILNNNRIIVIRYFDLDIEVHDIYDSFVLFGEIISCNIPSDLLIYDNQKKYVSRGYGFICFHDPEDAKRVVADLKDASIKGRPVDIAPIMSRIDNVNYEGLFEGCSSLTQISIPSSVTSIGDYAFCGCSSLTQISIPSSVIFIGNNAFVECSSLEQISVPSSVKIEKACQNQEVHILRI